MKVLQINKIPLFVIPVIIILGLAGNVMAQSAISCHCFKDRDYKPADRFAADEYILATSFNSLLSRVFDISKKQIIMLKMSQGVPQNDLLIGLKISRVTGEDINRILGMRRADQTWPVIISGIPRQDKVLSDPNLNYINSGGSVDLAGNNIADEIMAQFYGTRLEDIKELRKGGLSEKEITLLFLLLHARDLEQETLLKQRNKEGKSWSEIAHGLGIEPSAAGKLILAYPAKEITE